MVDRKDWDWDWDWDWVKRVGVGVECVGGSAGVNREVGVLMVEPGVNSVEAL